MTRKVPVVLHVLDSFAHGGAEMGVLRLVERLATKAFRHIVCVLRPNLGLKGQVPSGTVIRCLELRGRAPEAFWRLAQTARQTGAAVLHVNNLPAWPDTFVAARLAGCACIQTFHGVEESRPTLSRSKKMLLKIAARKSHRICAVSASARDVLAHLLEIPLDWVQVIENGVDTKRFSPCKSPEEKVELRKRLDLPEQQMIFVSVAGLRHVKNPIGIVEAYAKAFPDPRSWNNPLLLFVGTGPMEEDLRQVIEKKGLTDRVQPLGVRNDVADILKASDVFLLNSWTEGLSYSVLEAMACGLPTIVTAVGANPTLIEQGRTGYLYKPGDLQALSASMRQVLQLGSDGMTAMGKRAREKVVRAYGLDTMAEAYEQAYRQVIFQNKR